MTIHEKQSIKSGYITLSKTCRPGEGGSSEEASINQLKCQLDTLEILMYRLQEQNNRLFNILECKNLAELIEMKK